MNARFSLLKTAHALVFASLLGLLTSSALAQSSGYDANCDPRNYTADEMLRQELCSAHLGCRLTMKAANSACKVKDFFSNLGGVLGGRSTPDNLDVLEALNRTEVPQTSGVKKTNASAKPYYEGSRLPSYDRSNAAQISVEQSTDGGKPSGSLNLGKDGVVRWFEGTGARNSSNQLSGNGVQIDSKGLIKAGVVIDDAIGGGGIERAADASWAAGTFKAGLLEGSGYQLKSDGTGNAPVLEGTFKNNQPDGVMLATWPDFSSRKELWKDGKLVVAGPKVARGQIPPDPKTPEQEAAEKAAAEKAKFASDLAQLSNPGAIFAFADEWSSKGDMDKARAAWRSLMTRYPDSPFALKAADRLGGGSGGGAASTRPVSAPAGVSGTPQSAGSHEVTLVDRWIGGWENQPLLSVPESAYDKTVANFKTCGASRRCGPEYPASESPYAYDVGNIINPFRVSGAAGQQTPQCKYTPQAGYSLPYLPGSRSAFGLGGGIPGEQTCAYLLKAAIHEWMANKIEGRRGASALVNAAPVMPGTATGQCEADLQTYRDSSKAVSARVSPMNMRQSLQAAMYLEVNMYRILTTSCRGTSQASRADFYLQSAGQSLQTCRVMSSDPAVCVPKAP